MQTTNSVWIGLATAMVCVAVTQGRAGAAAGLPTQTIHVASGQIVCHPGNVDGNLSQVRQLTTEAAVAGARFVLFAEGALTGYVFTPEFLKAHALSTNSAPVKSLQALSRELGLVIAVGTIEQAGRVCARVSGARADPRRRLRAEQMRTALYE